MAASEKVHVFVAIFNSRFNPKTGTLSKSMVMLDEVADVIRRLVSSGKVKLSDRNPANFIKDYLRSNARNASWPEIIRQAGYTARQRTGEGQCFEFVVLTPGDEPFPDDFQLKGTEPEFTLQTLSLPTSTRAIVRADEQSVAQIAVKLHLLEHFLAASPAAREWGLQGITHLQNNVKLRATEIDALYQAELGMGHDRKIGAITVEVKSGNPIIGEQIANQARAVLAGNRAFAFCVPAILKRFNRGTLAAMHLPIVWRDSVSDGDEIALGDVAFSARYILTPPISNI